MGKHLLAFDVEQSKRASYARCDRGHQSVAVARIVGSVGRADDFDPRFRYRRGAHHVPRDAAARLRRVRQLFLEGKVPPVELYQIGEDYFVLDGHHRVAIARELGQEYLDAHVVEYRPDPTDPSSQVYYERQAFIRAVGLRDVYATEPGRYPRLLSRIQSYHHELLEAAGGDAAEPRLLPVAALTPPPTLDLRAAARRWLDSEYRPVVEILQAEGFVEAYPGRALGDLYGYVCDHRWYLSERRGWDVGVDAALIDYLAHFSPTAHSADLVDPIVALGSDVLERAIPSARSPLRRLGSSAAVALIVGLVALPVAFLRGLRPGDYRFRRRPLVT